MTPALWAAKTGLDAQQLRMAIISNNLANADTNGFKSGRAVFEDLVYQNMRQAGGLSSQQTELPSGVNIGTGVRIVSTEKRFTQGSLVQTGGPLDVGIEGRGFFEVLQPDGTIGYTRDGSFKLNSEGEMVSSSGYPLQPGITIPEGAQSITIGSDGVVSAQLAGCCGSADRADSNRWASRCAARSCSR
jgi:flagellar basal-body rod protein FlgG